MFKFAGEYCNLIFQNLSSIHLLQVAAVSNVFHDDKLMKIIFLRWDLLNDTQLNERHMNGTFDAGSQICPRTRGIIKHMYFIYMNCNQHQSFVVNSTFSALTDSMRQDLNQQKLFKYKLSNFSVTWKVVQLICFKRVDKKFSTDQIRMWFNGHIAHIQHTFSTRVMHAG